MPYRGELDFLTLTLRKSHIKCTVTEGSAVDVIYEELHPTSGSARIDVRLSSVLPEVLYKYKDVFGRSWHVLRLPDRVSSLTLCIGPYLTAPLSDGEIYEIGEATGFARDAKAMKYLREYYTGLAVVAPGSPIELMIGAFCERIWSSPTYIVKDLEAADEGTVPFSKTMLSLEPQDTLVNKKAIEQRYSFENEMIRAVALGRPHTEPQFHIAFLSKFFEKRAADPLRNAKNYGIIMNTLLRKAAEQGGVHPIYLDRTSSDFATRIESLGSLSAIPPLMSEMFRTYCRLVRENTLGSFSAVVQRAILIIDADLSANLAPRVLAKSLGVSLPYLSVSFKKSTGVTLSQYILTRRIEYARYLLRSTSMQIQSIALHCGIMDAQYFSKLFKKATGKSPGEFRTTVKSELK